MLNLPGAFLGLANMAAAAFGAPFWDGVVVSQQTPGAYDDDGQFVPGQPPSNRACKVQIDALDERLRPEGWTAKDCRFIVLSASLTGDLDSDASIKVTDTSAPSDFQTTWLVSSLQRDPAGIGWIGRGTKT